MIERSNLENKGPPKRDKVFQLIVATSVQAPPTTPTPPTPRQPTAAALDRETEELKLIKQLELLFLVSLRSEATPFRIRLS